MQNNDTIKDNSYKESTKVLSEGYNKNKRQIYVWTENKEFFDNLKNKSKFINLLIKKYRADVGDLDKE